jgi:PAS domain S-box-containing protein
MAEKSELLHNILDHIIQGVVMFDNARRLVIWNKQYESILKFPEGFLNVGMSNFELAHFLAKRGDFGAGDPETLTDERLDLLWSGTTKHAGITVLGAYSYDVMFESTNDDGLVITYTDITERQRTEEALKTSEERFRDFADSASDWVWETDEKHRFTIISDRFLHVTKGRAKHVFGKTRFDVAIAPHDPIWEKHRSTLDFQKPFRNFTYEYAYIDGHPQWLSISGQPVYDGQGKFKGYRGTGREVTEQVKMENRAKLAEEELRQSEERANAILDTTFQLQGLLHPDGTVIVANATSLSIIDASKKDVTGKLFWDCPWWTHSADDQKKLKNAVKQAAQGEAAHILVTHSSPDGTLLDIDFRVSPVRNERGDIIFLVPEGHDITELKKIETKLAQSNAELQDLNELKNKFMGMAAHDMRNPLGAIRSMAQMILEFDLDEDKKLEFITSIRDVSDQMLNLLNDLLDVSAIESGKFDLNWEPGNLGKLLKSRIDLVAFSADAKGINITTDIEEMSEIEFDHTRIAQVLDNLLTNAVKFSPSGSIIDTAVQLRDKYVDVIVQDHGQGISESEVDKVFMAFEKLSSKPTAGEKSTGLGLAIVKKIVDGHSGTISVDSTLGEGSKFTLSLPLVAKIVE